MNIICISIFEFFEIVLVINCLKESRNTFVYKYCQNKIVKLTKKVSFNLFFFAGRSFRTTLVDLLCHIGLTRKSHDGYSYQNQKSQYKRRTTQIELTTVNIDISTSKDIHRNSINEMIV